MIAKDERVFFFFLFFEKEERELEKENKYI